MNEERTPREDPREPVLKPQESPNEVVSEPSIFGWKLAAVAFVMLAGIALGYGWVQHDAAQQLATEREDLRTSLAQAKTQADTLIARVNALSAAQAEEQAARVQKDTTQVEAESEKNGQFPPAPSATPHRSHATVVRRRVPVDDPRWAKFQQQLGAQQNLLAENQKELAQNKDQIAQTQSNLDQAKSDLNSNLQSARTELGGDIARNHSELVALQKKGERNYFEFSFEKSKTLHHTGPISIALRKADAKHEYCDLDMVVDDKSMTRKHVNLYESIALYPEGYPQAVEVVINHIDKDAIRGYVSEPKYRSTEQATASASPAAPNATSAAVSASPDPAPASDAKLEHRDAQGIVH